MALRQKLRRTALGLATVLGWRRSGWFIPHRYAALLPPPGSLTPYAAAEQALAAAEPHFRILLDQVDARGDALLAIAASGQMPGGARFDQGWFPTLDAVIAYTVVRTRRPRRIVEVGSGHSTRFLARAVADGGLDCEIIAIDPAPRAAIAALPNVRLLQSLVHRLPPADWPRIEAGDMLFIDSSHVLMPGSDVDLLLNRVLPALAQGVLVHLHDIFLPDDYPADWAWRNYNEQQAVLGLLTSGQWRVLFASHYAGSRLAARVGSSIVARLPAFAGARPASLWLERTAS